MKNLIIILFALSLVQIAKSQTVYYWADGKKNELQTDSTQFLIRFTAKKVFSENAKGVFPCLALCRTRNGIETTPLAHQR
jgi:hypothetical protein